jgi:katanin p60 ATPase-containing subunit A1
MRHSEEGLKNEYVSASNLGCNGKMSILLTYLVDIPLPDMETRLALLKINLEQVKIDADVDLNTIATKLEGYSGADITNVCRDSAMMPMRRKTKGMTPEQIRSLQSELKESSVTQLDFETSIRKISSSVSAADIKRYEEWMKEFGSV